MPLTFTALFVACVPRGMQFVHLRVCPLIYLFCIKVQFSDDEWGRKLSPQLRALLVEPVGHLRKKISAHQNRSTLCGQNAAKELLPYSCTQHGFVSCFFNFFLFYFCFAHHRVEFKNEKSQQASFWVTLPLWEKKNASEKKAGAPLRRIIPLHAMAPGAGRHHLYSFCLAARVYTVELTMVWLLLIHSGLGVVLFVSDTAILDNSVE